MTAHDDAEAEFVHPDFVRAAVTAIQAAHAGGTRSVEFWDEVRIGLRAVLPMYEQQLRRYIADDLDEQAYNAADCHVDGPTCTEAMAFARAAQRVRGCDA